MGYTHYWKPKTKTCSENLYLTALEDIRKIVKSKITILANGFGESNTEPELEKGVRFNGIEDDSHETFSLPENFKKFDDFNFCKTARKDYDVVVVACLTVLHNYLGDKIKISSDGDREELEDGKNLAASILNKNFLNIYDELPPNSIELLKKLKTE